jgi:NAD(P)-dependent dehydrogenase (short-subunit alcohol dehydrogenase family)
MRVFITGGTGEIGQQLASLYLQQGDQVGVCGGGREDFDLAFPQASSTLHFFEVDLCSYDQTTEAFSRFIADGPLDLLICLAGINNGIPFKGEEIDFEVERKILEVNLMGTLNAVAAATPTIASFGGSIILVSSAAGVAGFPETPGYCTSKAGLFTIGESLNLRLATKNIHVGVVAPGYVKTKMARAVMACVDNSKYAVTAEEAAREIKESADKRRTLYIFPWQIRIASHFARYLPRKLFRALYRFWQRRRGVGKDEHHCCMRS